MSRDKVIALIIIGVMSCCFGGLVVISGGDHEAVGFLSAMALATVLIVWRS